MTETLNLSTQHEIALHRNLLRFTDMPYKFGGRGYGGIDCSSLIVTAVRRTRRMSVSALPWMTADQLGKGRFGITRPAPQALNGEQCVLAFFDWDEDSIFEHAAVRLLDGSWIWSSSSAGKVIRVNPAIKEKWRPQWREIEGALDGKHSALRVTNWRACERLLDDRSA